MVVICEAELKKRAEHNHGRLHDLEEVSLHQLNIRRIENLDKFCRDVRIVYLQVFRTTFYRQSTKVGWMAGFKLQKHMRFGSLIPAILLTS